MAWAGALGRVGSTPSGLEAGARRISRERRRLQRLRQLRVLAVAVALMGGFAVLLVHTVSITVSSPDLYASALVRADAYDRIYRQVLSDPALTARVAPVVADLPSAAPLISDNLRTLLPPATLRRMVEPIVAELVDYVRGDVARPTLTVDIRPIVDSVHAVANQYLAGGSGQVWTVLAATAAEFRPLLERVLHDALHGDLLVASADSASGPPPVGRLAELAVAFVPPAQRASLQPQVEARLLDDDVSGALELVIPGAQAAAQQAVAESPLGDAGQVSQVSLPTDGLVQGGLGHGLARLRTAVRVMSLAEGPLWVLTALAGALALAATRGLRGRAIRLVAMLSTALGGGLLLVSHSSQGLSGQAVAKLDRRLGDLPPSLRRLVGDVSLQVLHGLGHHLAQVGQACLLGGLTLWAVSEVAPVAWRWARTPLRVVAPTGAITLISLGVVHVPLWPWQVAAAEHRCNGAAELCDLRYDQVVQAASHNAMAAADYRFFAPAQDVGITAQLESGVRALLIDTHYWESSFEVDQLLARLPDPLAGQARTWLAPRLTPRPGTWLCHRLCALGALDLVSGLSEVAEFLDRHPDEVVTLDIEDHISPADTEVALRAAGLLGRVATPPPPGGAWPTLGEMIAARRNLVVFAESAHDPSRPWYGNFFDYVMDTPYNAPSVAALSCEVNRGGRDRSMFLLNHWVSSDSPGRDDATAVNQADVIVERAHRCAAERHARVTMIAVDFADIGDVVDAVAQLNREAASTCAARPATCPASANSGAVKGRAEEQPPPRPVPPPNGS